MQWSGPRSGTSLTFRASRIDGLCTIFNCYVSRGKFCMNCTSWRISWNISAEREKAPLRVLKFQLNSAPPVPTCWVILMFSIPSASSWFLKRVTGFWLLPFLAGRAHMLAGDAPTHLCGAFIRPCPLLSSAERRARVLAWLHNRAKGTETRE